MKWLLFDCNESKKKGSTKSKIKWLIISIITAVTVITVVAIAAYYYCIKGKRQKNRKQEEEEHEQRQQHLQQQQQQQQQNQQTSLKTSSGKLYEVTDRTTQASASTTQITDSSDSKLIRNIYQTKGKVRTKQNKLQDINERINRQADEEFKQVKKELIAFYKVSCTKFSNEQLLLSLNLVLSLISFVSGNSMLFILFILLPNLFSVLFGRFIDRNEANDYEKNWIKKSNRNIFPTEALYRSPELEYIKYEKEQNVKSRDYDILRRMIPGIMLGNWIEPLVLTITDPDEQAVYLPMTVWDKNENDNDIQQNESMFERDIVSTTTKSTIQLFEHAATTKNDLPNDGELEKAPKLSNELEQQPSMSKLFEELNITEVYEEPFVRVYVKPLCEGSIC
ncbi:unnamed protein product [Brugia pahangi]|uniref:Transmembrane protein n=1 Tax=Brugia pahangi TaxID=6280 RepID=A0A0N4T486_BRUPA|nr:unnamed protein product [Brugia pahangi]